MARKRGSKPAEPVAEPVGGPPVDEPDAGISAGQRVPAKTGEPVEREPVRRIVITRNEPVVQRGGHVLTERGWVLDK